MKPQRVIRNDAPADVLMRIELYESRLPGKKRSFDVLFGYSKSLLRALLGAPYSVDELVQKGVYIASHSRPELLGTMAEVTRIANKRTRSKEDCVVYEDGMLRLVHDAGRAKLPDTSRCTLLLAPEREGAYLASRCSLAGWTLTTPNKSCRPAAKRIPYYDDLLVGVCTHTPYTDLLHARANFDGAYLVDGALASGATAIAMIETYSPPVNGWWHVVVGHATAEGLTALLRYAEAAGVNLEVSVGHVSGTLSSHLYAVDESGAPIIGDVGDTILGPYLPEGLY